MEIFIEQSNKFLKKKFTGKVIELLSLLKINPGEVLVVRNKELLIEEDELLDSDSIRILSVISGG
jgi:sulfur carrier protein ThiS|tara:strand:+ start:364 stop:558 length:195 start_codon:yes stop_codon:yes gene_type:complete